MELLERIWEIVSLFFSSILRGFERTITTLFGSSNARYVKRLQAKVDAINALESKFQAMSDEELKAQTERFRERLAAGETLDQILVEAFAVCREGGRRFNQMRHYDVQLIGGMVLHEGKIAEMVTGEGKTLVATLPAYLNALEGKGVHVITVNDYLARRDMEWMAPLYMGLGLTVGAIQNDMGVRERQQAYACDITYGTNNEFGFDYLRDNMRPAARGDERYPKPQQQSQGNLNFAIIDEVDNILIDEARTPLIISGPAHQNIRQYGEADRIARALKRDEHFTVNEKDHSATLTDDGVRAAEKMAGVESFYTAGNMEWPHMIDNALRAHYLYQRDVNYVVKEGRVVIVDEFTGRLMEGRQWSDGLHQAVEAKEGVKIKEETQTLATITLQNYFKLYNKLSGMTGTAMTEAGEFWKIYQLDVIAIPTNRGLQRIEFSDVIYPTETAKFRALADEIERIHKYDVVVLKSGDEVWGELLEENDSEVVIRPKESKEKKTIQRSQVTSIEHQGRPILVGTVSIEKSERLSALLDKRGIKHETLNAKHHKREAEIVAQAGRRGAVTIATNMAGRGTDIVLGGNAETMAWAILQDQYETRLDVPREEWDNLVDEIEEREDMKRQGNLVREIGGLHVIGTERHESRRIDLQLRGRCGRQGDPGSSRFFLSLEDDIMRIFAGPWVKSFLERMGWKDDEALESRMVSRRIESAQKRVEERNFEIRKNLLEYDEVMDEQRKRIYKYRQNILDGVNCRDLIQDMIEEQIEDHVDVYLARDFAVETFAAFAGSRLLTSIEPKLFRGSDYTSAERIAKDEAERAAESDIHGAVEENLPSDEEVDSADWNWEALAKFSNTRFKTNLRDRDLKQIGRDRVDEFLVEKAYDAIQKEDLSDGAIYLEEHYAEAALCAWVAQKYGVEVDRSEVIDKEKAEVKQLLVSRVMKRYAEREAEYPVMAGLYRFGRNAGNQAEAASTGTGIDRENLILWASERFDTSLSLEDLKNKQRDEIRQMLIAQSVNQQEKAVSTLAEAKTKLSGLIDPVEGGLRSGNGASKSLSEWLKDNVKFEVDPTELESLETDALESRIANAVQERYHPEMRRMERFVLLEIVDSAWKDHLLAMDYLRSAVGQRGMAQLDPKVEYKREGMRMFADLWKSIGERATDLIFRMEQLNEDFVSSTWTVTSAVHEEAKHTSEIAKEQQQAIDNTQKSGDTKLDPIRYRGPKVGRNDPCPCGSGKKYKQCCMRKDDRH